MCIGPMWASAPTGLCVFVPAKLQFIVLLIQDKDTTLSFAGGQTCIMCINRVVLMQIMVYIAHCIFREFRV